MFITAVRITKLFARGGRGIVCVFMSAVPMREGGNNTHVGVVNFEEMEPVFWRV